MDNKARIKFKQRKWYQNIPKYSINKKISIECKLTKNIYFTKIYLKSVINKQKKI